MLGSIVLREGQKETVVSKELRSGLFALLVVLSVLSLATMACDGVDGEGGSFLDNVVEDVEDFAEEVIEGEKQNWGEVGDSFKDNPAKSTGFIGSPGKFLCESTGGRYVASIDACYKK